MRLRLKVKTLAFIIFESKTVQRWKMKPEIHMTANRFITLGTRPTILINRELGPLSICVYYHQTLVSCVQSHLLWVEAVPWCFGCSNVSASLAFGISCVSRPLPVRALKADGQWVTVFWFIFQTYVVLVSFPSLQSGCCASLEEKTGSLLQF